MTAAAGQGYLLAASRCYSYRYLLRRLPGFRCAWISVPPPGQSWALARHSRVAMASTLTAETARFERQITAFAVSQWPGPRAWFSGRCLPRHPVENVPMPTLWRPRGRAHREPRLRSVRAGGVYWSALKAALPPERATTSARVGWQVDGQLAALSAFTVTRNGAAVRHLGIGV